MERTISLLKPTGRLTLGNYLGALRGMASLARARHDAGLPAYDCFYGVADLHALTVPHDPHRLRTLSRELATLLLAVGMDEATLFRQSRVTAHVELAELLLCVATTGELGRMIQFKEKGRGRAGTRCALFTYPVMMAADILLYGARRVPVGEDQRQHLELTRTLAQRFNATYGEVFVVPEMTAPSVGARVMNLQDPLAKMGKSEDNPAGIVYLLDPPEVVRRKVARAVTDSDTGPGAVRFDRARKPGVSNLLEILFACRAALGERSEEPLGSERRVELPASYGALKAEVAEAVIALILPIQGRYAELAAAPDRVEAAYLAGEARCRAESAVLLARVRELLGLR